METEDMFYIGEQSTEYGITLIAYDISDNRRRRQLDRCLQGYGQRVQESVFEASVGKRKKQEMITQIRSIIDPKEDNVRIYQFIRETDILPLGENTAPRIPEICVL